MLLWCLLLPLSGLTQTNPKLFKLNHGNLEREYFVYTPKSYDSKKALQIQDSSIARSDDCDDGLK